MTLIRWQPFHEMDSVQREMNRLFDSLSPTQPENGKAYFPPAEMTVTADEIHLKLEVPGMDAKDIDIQVSAQSVEISGERKSLSRVTAEGKKRSEFRYGVFHRAISLPARVQNANVNAKYQDGILYLTLPKEEAEKTKVVRVNVS